MKLNLKELRILAVIIGIWGFVLLGSGITMNYSTKTVIKTTYSLSVDKKKISESQAKKNEIKLKNITIYVNNPISVNIEDYLENPEQIDSKLLDTMTIDTSLVNINQAGTYTYTIKSNKKKYTGTITVKEKELPDVAFTLKNLEFTIGDSISTNPRSYINETITDEVYNALTLDLSQVISNTEGTYQYYITYKNTTYTAQITIKAPGPKVTGPNNASDNTQKEEDKEQTTEKQN